MKYTSIFNINVTLQLIIYTLILNVKNALLCEISLHPKVDGAHPSFNSVAAHSLSVASLRFQSQWHFVDHWQ